LNCKARREKRIKNLILLDVTASYKAVLLLQQSSSPNKKTKNTRKFGKKRESKGNPRLLLLSSPSLLLCRGIYRRFKT